MAEQKIKEAMERGEFDNLKGHGQPLELEDLSYVPEELRVGYKLLRNAGMVPEELVLSKEILSLQAMLELCQDRNEGDLIRKKLSEKQLRYRMMMEARGWQQMPAFEQYESKLKNKIEGADNHVPRNNT